MPPISNDEIARIQHALERIGFDVTVVVDAHGNTTPKHVRTEYATVRADELPA
ncbi:MAG: hypothetical protein WCL53_04720 [Chloroflexota bacterium]